ncbi:MAG: peroxiredoxin family protein, partial [Halioglobus sp.]
MSLVFFVRNVREIVLLSFLLAFAAVPVRSESAPEFALKDSAGNTVSLEDFKGKPLVLHFWASWCP